MEGEVGYCLWIRGAHQPAPMMGGRIKREHARNCINSNGLAAAEPHQTCENAVPWNETLIPSESLLGETHQLRICCE